MKSQQPPIVWKGAKSSKTSVVLEDKKKLIRMKSLLLEDFFYFSLISSLIEEVPTQYDRVLQMAFKITRPGIYEERGAYL